MRYAAELDKDGVVLRVIVCDSLDWVRKNMPGNWTETKVSDPVEAFAGKGYTYDSATQTKFDQDAKPSSNPKPIEPIKEAEADPIVEEPIKESK